MTIRGHNKPWFNWGAGLPLGAIALAITAATPAFGASGVGGEAANAAAASLDTLELRNGDRLYGKLLGVEMHGTVRWEHPDAAQPIEFKPESVAQIDFGAQNAVPIRDNYGCKVRLKEGDELEGNLVSCDNDWLQLDTPYAGRLKIGRHFIHSVWIVPATITVFDGISGLEGWTQGSNALAFAGDAGKWTYHSGAFYAGKPASIARMLDLPDVAEIEFDLAWKGLLNLAVALYTDSLEPILLLNKESGPDFGGFYSLRIQSVFMELMRVKKHEPLKPQQLGDVLVPSLGQSNHVHIVVRVNKPRSSLAVFIEDSLIKQWVDPSGFAGEGKGIRFVQNSPAGSIKISNLRVCRWDGILQENGPGEAEATNDNAWLSDGRVLSGRLESIAEGKLTVRTSKEKEEVPLGQLRNLEFAQPAGRRPSGNGALILRATPGQGGALTYQWQALQPKAKPQSSSLGNTRATFEQGGFVVFELESWSPTEVLVESPVFGKAKFKPAAFSRLQFLEGADSKPPEAGAE